MPPRISNRGVHKAPANEIAKLDTLIEGLIKENRELKRRLAKLSIAPTTDLRKLGGLIRRVERGLLDGASSPASKRATATRRPRKPASPETQEKRRAALEKARAVRRAKGTVVNPQSKLITIEDTKGSQLAVPRKGS